MAKKKQEQKKDFEIKDLTIGEALSQETITAMYKIAKGRNKRPKKSTPKAKKGK